LLAWLGRQALELVHVAMFGLGIAFMGAGLYCDFAGVGAAADSAAATKGAEAVIAAEPGKLSAIEPAPGTNEPVTIDGRLEVRWPEPPAPRPPEQERVLTLEDASRDFLAFIEGPLRQATAAVRDIAVSGSDGTVGSRLEKLDKLKSSLSAASAEQDRLKREYRKVAHVPIDCDFLEIELAIDEYIATLKSVAQDDPISRLSTHPSSTTFFAAMEPFSIRLDYAARAMVAPASSPARSPPRSRLGV